jgi:phage gp29-like protein
MANTPEMQELAKADHGIALSAAYTGILVENPDTVLARRGRDYTVYNELLRDDQVQSTFQQRRTGVTSATWGVEAASDSTADQRAADFLREQLQHIQWDDVTDKMLYGIFYGFAVGEALYAREGGLVTLDAIKVRDRARFKFDADHVLHLVDTQHPQGKAMPPRKFWTYTAGGTHHDNPYGQGLAHSLYWPVFFKRSDIKFWMVFLEKFGMPTTAIRLPDGQIDDPRQLNKAKAVLAAIQADSGAVIPDSMTWELIEAARSGTADYETLCQRMDQAISKVVLSQTMTTDNGSSLSQAQVHEGVSRAVIDSDSDLINESFRRSVAAWLTAWNFPSAQVPRIVRNTEPEEDLNERAERDGKIYALGFEPTEDYVEETYGPGWVKRQAPAPLPGQTLTNGTGELPAEFAEISTLLKRRADHRSDQQIIADAAAMLARNYAGLYGDRVEQLLAYLEDSQDIETFQKRITDMMREPAPQVAVETVQKATLAARLMGLFRGQRD